MKQEDFWREGEEEGDGAEGEREEREEEGDRAGL